MEIDHAHSFHLIPSNVLEDVTASERNPEEHYCYRDESACVNAAICEQLWKKIQRRQRTAKLCVQHVCVCVYVRVCVG